MSKDIEKKDKPITTKYLENISETPIDKPNCKFCQSKFRAEAEKEWERTRNYTVVHKFLLEKGDDISFPSVRRHIVNHYTKYEENLRMLDYIEDASKWYQPKIDRKKALQERIAILNKELFTIGADTPSGNLDQRRRSADAMKKLSDTITALEDKVAEIEDTMEPVLFIITQLNAIITEKVKATNDEKIKREYMSIFEELKDRVGDMEIQK